MNELPAKLLLSVLLAIELIVARDVAVKRTQQNHADHSGEKKNDDEAVDD